MTQEHALEFIDGEPPPEPTRPKTRENVNRLVAQELRARSGQWAVYRDGLSASTYRAYAGLINKGELKGFGHGFQARYADGLLYVRHVGEAV